MPYVSESVKSTFTDIRYGRSTSTRTATVATGPTKTQLGFRSAPPSEKEAIAAARTRRGVTTKQVIADLETVEAYFLGTDAGAWTEHDRTYEEFARSAPASGNVRFKERYSSSFPWSESRSSTAVLVPGGFVATYLPSPTSQREFFRIGESLRRATVPDAPTFNLVRSLGELKDAPMMFKAMNYRPRTTADFGSAYLNQVFGVQPTVSDMQKLAEAALALAEPMDEYTEKQSRIIRRRKSYTLNEESQTSQVGTQGSSPGHIQVNPLRWQVWGESPKSALWWSGGQSHHYKETVTAYARYEQVIVRNGSTDNQASFRQKAQRLLGSGLSASVIYDLSPYTWLLGWYKDFGGILRYQENLSNSNTFARGGGISHVREGKGALTLSAISSIPNELIVEPCMLAGTSSYRRHQRFAGTSPYSLTPGSPSDLDGSQWAILAAMGLARSTGIPLGWGAK